MAALRGPSPTLLTADIWMRYVMSLTTWWM